LPFGPIPADRHVELAADLPQVVASASEILKGDVAARREIVGGSFFEFVPEAADIYPLKGVLHDWPDDDAVRILRNTRRAIRPEGTVDSAPAPPDFQTCSC
jgi:O-methyltransferase domain